MTTTETKWAERVRAWRSSGGTADAFAEGKGYQGATLRWWASKLRRRASRRASSAESTVKLVRVTPTLSVVPLVVRVGAASVEVRRGFDATLLREVVEALGGGAS